MPHYVLGGGFGQQECLAAKYPARINDASSILEIVSEFSDLRIIQAGQRRSPKLERAPMFQVVPQVAVEFQIVLQKQNVIHIAAQCSLKSKHCAASLPSAGIPVLAIIQLELYRCITPIGFGQIFQGFSPCISPVRARNHHKLNPNLFCLSA